VKTAAAPKPAVARPAKRPTGKKAVSSRDVSSRDVSSRDVSSKDVSSDMATKGASSAAKPKREPSKIATRRRQPGGSASVTSDQLGLLGVHHVALGVTDLDAARAFYGELLGMSEDPLRPDFGVAGMWYQVGAQQFHLGLVDEPPPVSGAHTAIHVRDLDVVLDRLEQAGVRFRRVPHIPGAGRQAVLRDPSGNRLELNQPEPR
jgi:glyoxylase I family protein